jgi:metal-sulfur cluster biosynthetic enzyme
VNSVSEDTGTETTLWESDSTHPKLADEIRGGLREVMDPELGLSIIALGLVRQVQVDEEAVNVRMILTTPFCPYGPALLDQTRTKVEEVAGMETSIELGMEPWHPQLMEDGAAADWGFF